MGDYNVNAVDQSWTTAAQTTSGVMRKKVAATEGMRDSFQLSYQQSESRSAGSDVQEYRSGSYDKNASVLDKLQTEKEDQQAMEQLKETDYEAYMKKMIDRELSSCTSIGRLTAVAEKYGMSSVTYNGVTINVDSEHMQMGIGDTKNGDVIYAGKMSNGYAFNFNRDNIDDVQKVLELFSPEDINKILNAIAQDNMVKEKQQEIEATESSVVKM